MDSISNKYLGFVSLFGLGMLAVILELFILLKIDPPVGEKSNKNEAYRFTDILRLPLFNKTFMGYVLYLFSF